MNAKENLTLQDYWLTANNMVRWGVIGATYFGVGSSLAEPLSIISSLASEVGAAMTTPEDASVFSGLLTSPTLQNQLLEAHPIAKSIAEAVSVYHFGKTAFRQIRQIWRGETTLKKSAVHVFNIASRTAFLANQMGLIDFSPPKPQEPPKEKQSPIYGPAQRKIRVATVYDNKGNARRQEITDLVTANHRDYAKRWGLKHDVVSKSLVEKSCINPKKSLEDCSPYWNKIKYLQNWCQSPGEENTEEWAIYADDDAVYTNFQVDPSDAIDRLRGEKDSSFIIATEGEGTRYDAGAVNTGVIIVRKDESGCGVIDRIWKNRNVVTDPSDPTCMTYGLCKNQKNGDEQGATDKVFYRDQPRLVGTDVSRVLARDATHPKRGGIALNTVHRGGCMTALRPDGTLTGPYDISTHDMKVNPEGIWKEGDWIGQTAGYPMTGQDLSHQPMDRCTDDPTIPIEPIRLKKVHQLLAASEKSKTADPRPPQTVFDFEEPVRRNFTAIKLPCQTKREITFGAVYDNQNEPKRNAISEFVNANHQEYCSRWGIRHEVVSHSLLAGQCTDPRTQKPADCAPFWNKIQMYRNWLQEPAKPDTEEWRYYVDDDMLVANMAVDPSKAIDTLRGDKDTSFIIAEDVVDWQRWFFENSDPHLSINTGAMILRKDPRSREVIDAIWEARNKPVLKPTADCPTMGMCKVQSKSMQEQEALSLVLKNNPEIVGESVTIVPPRGALAMNTFYRDGCFVRNLDGWSPKPFTYEPMDQAENPDGAFRPSDWLVQTAGVPVWGKILPMKSGVCADDPSVEEGPVRLHKLQDLSQYVVRGSIYDLIPTVRFYAKRALNWVY